MPRFMPQIERPRFQIDPSAKLKILVMEGTDKATVEAQFNPKEIQIDRSVSWKKQEAKKRTADLEYTTTEPKSMTVELMFDGYENGESVQPQLDALEKMTQVMGNGPKLKRPPMVRVIWGSEHAAVNLPAFNAVVESLSIKYTMFARNGAVLRATATVKLKQADFPGVAKQQR